MKNIDIDSVSYANTREEAIEKLQNEIDAANKSYDQVKAISKPGSGESSLDIYYAGMRAAYKNALEILAEVPGIDHSDALEGEQYSTTLANNPQNSCAPSVSPQLAPEVQA